jgi:hypothetical protein
MTLAVAILVGWTADLMGQATPPPPRRAAPRPASRPTTPAYATGPIDPAADRLPPGYVGHNITQEFKRLSALDIGTKAEFETSEEYAARVVSIATGQKPLAFRVEPGAELNELPLFSYDADSQKYTVQVPDTPRPDAVVVGKGDPLRYLKASHPYGTTRTIFVRTSRRLTGSYKGRNAFGVGTIVRHYVDEWYLVDAPATKSGSVRFDIPMPRDLARQAKDDLRILVVLKPMPSPEGDLAVEMTDPGPPPTVANPVKSDRMVKVIFTADAAIWVYNVKSGEVLAKHPL